MRGRSTIDVLLLVVALALLGVVGYGLMMRANAPAAVVKENSAAEAAAAAESALAGETVAADGSVTANFGWTGDSGSAPNGSDESAESGSDASATLEEIEQPNVESAQWDLVNGSFAIVRATMNVNVRIGPGLDYGVIVAIPRDSEVQVMRRSIDAQWIRVMLSDGREGWIFGQLLELRQ